MSTKFGVVWKDGWLSHSETFVRDQMSSMGDWDFLKIGFHRNPNPLVEPDYAPFGNDPVSRALRKACGTSVFERRYIEKVQERGGSLIHAHFLSGGMNAAALARKLEIPLITTLHNPRVSFEQTRLPNVARAIYSRRFQHLAVNGGKFLAVSTHVAQAAVAAGLPANKVEVFHIGTKIVPLEPKINPSGIVFVGRLIEMKGVTDLLKAVQKLPASLRDVAVTIVGDGPLRSFLEQQVREMRLNVTFLGWVPSSRLPQVLAASEIFCAPSKSDSFGVQEGFGMVFLEAALQGLPCVAYRSGGVVDAVSDNENGFLVGEGDIDALSNALRVLLLDASARKEMGDMGRTRVEREFDLSIQSEKLQDIFDSMVASF